jgi:hypothetical protein
MIVKYETLWLFSVNLNRAIMTHFDAAFHLFEC